MGHYLPRHGQITVFALPPKADNNSRAPDEGPTLIDRITL
jgi:hypothetical protein